MYSYKEYQKKHGITAALLSKKEKDRHYRLFRKEYKKIHQDISRQNKHRVELVFDSQEWEEIRPYIEKSELSNKAYFIESSRGYEKQLRVVRKTDLTKRLEFLLLNTSNNINQQAYHFNKQKNLQITHKDFDALQNEVHQLRVAINRELTMPSSLQKFVQLQIAYHGEERFLERIDEILNNYRS